MHEFAVQVVQRVEQHVAHRPRIQEVIQAEPAILTLLKLAASHSGRANRWHAYEMLKHVGSRYVGWYAHNPAVNDSRFYEAYIEAIDVLIVPPDIENESAEDATLFRSLDQLRAMVLHFFPHVDLPGRREESA